MIYIVKSILPFFRLLFTIAGAGDSLGLKSTHKPCPKIDLNCLPKGRSTVKQDGKPVAAQVR